MLDAATSPLPKQINKQLVAKALKEEAVAKLAKSGGGRAAGGGTHHEARVGGELDADGELPVPVRQPGLRHAGSSPLPGGGRRPVRPCPCGGSPARARARAPPPRAGSAAVGESDRVRLGSARRDFYLPWGQG